MRIVFAGTPEVAVPSLKALVASAHEVVGVVTRPDAPAGRGRRPQASPVKLAAEAAGLEVVTPAHPRDEEFKEWLRGTGAELVAAVAYGALIPADVLDIPAHGWINLHFSLLPAYRGAAPVQRAVWSGEEITGATVFQIVEALDAGPVYGVMTYQVPPRATSGDVLGELAGSADRLLVGVVDEIAAGRARAVPQSGDGVSLAPKIEAADALVDWSAPAIAVDRQIRACLPAPGPWTVLRGERVRLGVLEMDDAGAPAEGTAAGSGGGPQAAPEGLERLEPGVIRAGKRAVWVGTGTGPVRLGPVKPAGRGWMEAAAWARGARLAAGERFGREAMK
ncbi:MAG: methionyl-tRNA formyltransferase [Bifidobacteriaceae bacterium]|jgi:methionyl-tRNA formyltransferase|nr:methionyl-tRNA formyltransferase [Bifidobacteriaceae bacterium]